MLRRFLLSLALIAGLVQPAVAQIAISQLPSVTLPLAGTELVPLVQGTTTRKATLANLFTAPASVPRGYIDGLLTGSSGGSNLFTVSAGQAADSTGTYKIVRTSTISKTLLAWSAGPGAGALDTGTAAANTWYHVYEIANPRTGVDDVMVSASVSGPLLPTGYTVFRRIGAMRTDGGANIRGFYQYGNTFMYLTSVLDVSSSTPTSGAQTTISLTVPSGVSVEAIEHISVQYASGGATSFKIYPVFAQGGQNLPVIVSAVVGNPVNGEVRIVTSSNSQVDIILTYSAPGSSYSLETMGWVDQRGQNQ